MIFIRDQRLPRRFWAKVRLAPETRCWEWTGALARGYGMLWWQKRMQQAHRIAYEAFRGPIAAGLEIDHLCRNPRCCNPVHLEPVTHRENVRRGKAAQPRTGIRRKAPHNVRSLTNPDKCPHPVD